MRAGHWWLKPTLAILAAALSTLGIAWAQDQVPEPDPGGLRKAMPQDKGKGPVGKLRKGGLRAPGGARPKDLRKAPGDPLAKAGAAQDEWPFHYKLKLATEDRQTLAATFFPSRDGANAPVLLMLHERGTGHSGRDFEDPVEELKGQGLAQHFQGEGYAVLVLDLRGHGENPRHEGEISPREWAAMVGDLQSAYGFLIDRHNRRELNLGKFGVIAVGETANLALAWAASPGGAVSSEGRITDIGGLVLVSPVADAQGLRFASFVNLIAPRIPLLVIAGDRDEELAKSVQPVIERHRLSKVMFVKTRLQGGRMLRFEPKIAGSMTKFLEEPIRFRTNSDWEPRYLWNPVQFGDVHLVAKKADPAAAKKAEAKGAAKKKDR